MTSIGLAGRGASRRWWRRAGFTLLEVLAALGVLVSVGIIAHGAGFAMMRLAVAAQAESVGLFLAEEKIEELLALPGPLRRSGNDDLLAPRARVRRIWRIDEAPPAPGFVRIEVSTSWEVPQVTILNLVAVAS